jgi:hypothetical protein
VHDYLAAFWRIEMENMIAKLLDDFEHGRMTRRQLIKGSELSLQMQYQLQRKIPRDSG